ncbi:excinuclease ABC subunit UvrA [Candidatus Beckwithbacteria bacterium]|nr:excinuclease ABC subunit UvrA [Candidatus Beckwithbacteria bacterium]
MPSDQITVKGAREHNLKNIDVTIPKNKLVVLTGISGSGKSSFAFDTLYAEGQRRYVESLSSYARQFLGIMKKPDVELIEGLSPAISIDQKSVSHNPRSTVGTITEIYDYFRLLFARIGHPHCPHCGVEIAQQSVDQIFDKIITLAKDKMADPMIKKTGLRLMLLSPVIQGRKGEFSNLLDSLRQKGFQRVRVDGHILELDEEINLIKTNKHNIDVVVDRLVLVADDIDNPKEMRTRLVESLETALKLSDGLAVMSIISDESFDFPAKPKLFEDHLFSERFACPTCNLTLPEIEPRMFSFNTPLGACPTCNGLGTLLKIDESLILNPNLSISEGGILPYNRMMEQGGWNASLVAAVAQDLGFSIKVPIKDMVRQDLEKILYGAGNQYFRVKGIGNNGRSYEVDHKFEGVIPNLERRYRETKSDFMRSEIERFMRKETCPDCKGSRLKPEALAVVVDQKNIAQVSDWPIKKTYEWIQTLKAPLLSQKELSIAAGVLKELEARLGFLLSVGLDYLTLSRTAATLAGGESQRIRLASQIGTGLSGVLYVLDEPSIGLHQRDNRRLLDTLKRLRDLGNTVVVVEHDMETMQEADHLVDFGPLAGEAGGEVVSFGTPEEVGHDPKSLTGQYLSGKKKIHVAPTQVQDSQEFIEITGCKAHNLKNISVKFPLNQLVCVTGVSGSGKSTLVDDTLYHALASRLNPKHKEEGEDFDELFGLERIKRVVMIDQSPIGRTPRSNPATYTKAFDHIREVFSQTAEAKMRGYKVGRFSFNVRGGRCEACEGEGQIKIEMQFLPDVYVDCEVCGGKRYNWETLQVEFKGKNIAQVLDMTVEEALQFFGSYSPIKTKLQTLYDVGLGYVRLGQPAPTLSGGEAQRIKLAAELSKTSTTNTIFLLDEPTTGLHFADLEKLLLVLKKLVEKGNTVIVIEHNMDLIKNADWIIDLGPEGGDGGGELVAEGAPEEITQNEKSWTGKYLKEIL